MINKTVSVVRRVPLSADAKPIGARESREGPAAGLKFNF